MPTAATRHCPACGRYRDVSAFGLHTRTGKPRPRCRECEADTRLRSRASAAAEPETAVHAFCRLYSKHMRRCGIKVAPEVMAAVLSAQNGCDPFYGREFPLPDPGAGFTAYAGWMAAVSDDVRKRTPELVCIDITNAYEPGNIIFVEAATAAAIELIGNVTAFRASVIVPSHAAWADPELRASAVMARATSIATERRRHE